ncbi:DNA topoisomerase 1-like [Hippoglossus hippoglossus]|uniref:DNA topoisomerase 1-like n=1 Tax=Hippoglossus hippoglossus TaxID=8267 RepID=UPI00148B4429|nr:DNA topoisomerase 1-like [Hippoglossus hippoglossus]
MGIEKEAKGDGKPKHRAPKLKRLSDEESPGAGGDTIKDKIKETIKDSTKPNKSAEKTDNGKSKKVRTPKKDTQESANGLSDLVKEEPEDEDFAAKKKGLKRKRIKEEHMEGPSHPAAKPTSKGKKRQHGPDDERDGETQKKKSKKRTEEVNMGFPCGDQSPSIIFPLFEGVKKEEGEHPVSKKPKRTKEQAEDAKLLKIKKKEEEEQSRWRWWEEEKYEDGLKWKFLEHKGPYFPPEYQTLPDDVHFLYKARW